MRNIFMPTGNDEDKKDSSDCLKAEFIAAKDLVVELKMKRSEVPGVHRVVQCDKK